jgi:hypothetical protein
MHLSPVQMATACVPSSKILEYSSVELLKIFLWSSQMIVWEIRRR